jgi:hypothetical protein
LERFVIRAFVKKVEGAAVKIVFFGGHRKKAGKRGGKVGRRAVSDINDKAKTPPKRLDKAKNASKTSRQGEKRPRSVERAVRNVRRLAGRSV